MYVCICKKVTDTQIRNAVVEGGVTKLSHLSKALGAFAQCGRCARYAKEVMQSCLAERGVSVP